MITYTKETGCFFQLTPDSKHYTLAEMKEYKGECSTDIIAIWDHDNNAFVGYHYGANTISIDELDYYVAQYVTEYETKQNAAQAEQERAAACVSYSFTREGIAAFERDTIGDIFAECDHGGENIDDYDIIATIGNRYIRVPVCADTHGDLMELIKNAWEEDQAL